MEKYINVEFERIDLRPDEMSSGGVSDGVHTTDNEHGRIIGIALNIDDEAALPLQKLTLRIDGREIFGSNFESEMIYHGGKNVAPNDKYFNYMNVDIDKSRIEWSLTDGGNTSHTSFNAYLYLVCLRKDELEGR